MGVGSSVNHALCYKPFERLGFVSMPTAGGPEIDRVNEFGDETRIEEVEDCVFHTTDVDIYGE